MDDEDAVMVRDPVCERWIDSRWAHAQRLVEGRSVYLCCRTCERFFDAAPERFSRRSDSKGPLLGQALLEA